MLAAAPAVFVVVPPWVTLASVPSAPKVRLAVPIVWPASSTTPTVQALLPVDVKVSVI